MRAVIQRVSRAAVTVNGQTVGQIDHGMLVLLGIGHADTAESAHWLAEKLTGLRIFEDAAGKMNRSLGEVNGAMLVVSQFTLFGDCRKGRRPSFVDAARPEQAVPIYEAFVEAVRAEGIPVQTGQFGAMMQVQLINEGPVTLVLETP
jgi:D-tyrosyl-tRNA(Tyr) deacylase